MFKVHHTLDFDQYNFQSKFASRTKAFVWHFTELQIESRFKKEIIWIDTDMIIQD